MPLSSLDRRRWLVVALAFAAIMLNYVDRQIIAILKPTLQAQFNWTNRDYSHMASAYQLAAALSFLGSGWFIDRVGLRKGFAIGVGTWSLAGMAHALVATVSGFVTARVALGVAEAVGTPAQVKTAAAYFPPEQRSMMLGIGNMASNFGAVVSPLAVPPLALWLGWRSAFLITGGLGLVWVVVWLSVNMPPASEPGRDRRHRPCSLGLDVAQSPAMGPGGGQGVFRWSLVVPALLRSGPVPSPLRFEPGHPGLAGGLHLQHGRAGLARRRLAAFGAATAGRGVQRRAQGIDAAERAAHPAGAAAAADA